MDGCNESIHELEVERVEILRTKTINFATDVKILNLSLSLHVKYFLDRLPSIYTTPHIIKYVDQKMSGRSLVAIEGPCATFLP